MAFSIPASWREEYDADGGGTFYEDHPDSGTLRLNVLTFKSEDMPASQMAATAFDPGTFQVLGSGYPLRRTVKEANEDQNPVHLHIWEVAVPVPPRKLRIVIFCHTILATQESDPKIAAELAFLDSSIRSAQFSEQHGLVGD